MGCTTTALQIGGGLQADPEYSIRAELFQCWLLILRQLPDIRSAIHREG